MLYSFSRITSLNSGRAKAEISISLHLGSCEVFVDLVDFMMLYTFCFVIFKTFKKKFFDIFFVIFQKDFFGNFYDIFDFE